MKLPFSSFILFVFSIASAFSASTAIADEYLFQLLAKPAYLKSWNMLFRSEKNVDTWLAMYGNTKDGPTTPSETLKLKDGSYQLASVCETHSCAANRFYVLFSPNGDKAWGLLLKGDEDERFFGKPDDEKKAVLQTAADE
jgi:hypothetical protein